MLLITHRRYEPYNDAPLRRMLVLRLTSQNVTLHKV